MLVRFLGANLLYVHAGMSVLSGLSCIPCNARIDGYRFKIATEKKFKL